MRGGLDFGFFQDFLSAFGFFGFARYIVTFGITSCHVQIQKIQTSSILYIYVKCISYTNIHHKNYQLY